MLHSGQVKMLSEQQQQPIAIVPDQAIAIFRDTTRFWIQRVLVPILTVVGLFGNTITIIIMTRRGMRSTTNMYLAALAFVDMLYLILTFLLGLSHYPNMAAPEYYLYWKMKPFLMMLCDVSSNTSVWLTVTFTIERYIAVEYPMRGKVWRTEARAKLLIIFVFLFSILFALPVPFEWEIIKKPLINKSIPTSFNFDGKSKNENLGSTRSELDFIDNQLMFDNENTTTIATTLSNQLNANDASDDELAKSANLAFVWGEKNSSFGSNETYKTIYYRLTALFFYIIPIILLVYFNYRLCQSVHASKRHRDTMLGGTVHRGEKKISNCSNHSKSLVQLPSSTNFNRVVIKKSFRSSTIVRSNLSSNSKPNPNPISNLDSASKETKSGFKANGRSSCSSSSYSTSTKDITNSAADSASQNLLIRQVSSTASIAEMDKLGDPKAFVEIGTGANEHNVQPINCDQGPRLSAAEAVELSRAETLSDKAGDIDVEEDGDEQGEEQERRKLNSSKESTPAPSGSQPVKSSCHPLSPRRFTKSLKSNSNISIRAGTGDGSANHRQQQQQLQQHNHQNHSTQERRITIMLIAVVILFLICQLPSAIMILYTSTHELVPNTNEQALVLAFGNIFNFLMAVNAAGNFVLYSLLSKKYRRTFVRLFCICFKLSPKNDLINSRTPFSVRFDIGEQSSRISNNQQLSMKKSNIEGKTSNMARHTLL